MIQLDGGLLTMSASEGIGAAGKPIVTSGGGSLSAVNAPRDEDGRATPAATRASSCETRWHGDLAIVAGELAGVRVDSGSGDIEIANDAGSIHVRSVLRAKPFLTTDGPGGDIELSVAPGSQIRLEVPLFANAAGIGSGGTQTYDGDVVLAGRREVESGGDIEILGGLDASDDATGPVSFTVTLGDEDTDSTALTVQDGIGAQRALGSFALNAPADASIELDTGSVSTSGGQSYGADLELAQTAALNAGGAIDFAGDVTSARGAHGRHARAGPLHGAGDQSVEEADDLLLNPAGRPPSRPTPRSRRRAETSRSRAAAARADRRRREAQRGGPARARGRHGALHRPLRARHPGDVARRAGLRARAGQRARARRAACSATAAPT